MTSSSAEFREVQYSRMLMVLGSFIAIGIAIAVGAVYGSLAQWSLLGIGLSAVAYATWQSRLVVHVDGSGVQAGRAHIEWDAVQRAEALDAAGLRAAITTEAHPTDYLRIRSTSGGLRLWLGDATDPHRCWVVSVRRPAALTAILDHRAKGS